MLGSINMDLAVRTSRLPVAGETVLGNSFRTSQGGKGANQAMAAARAGAEVGIIGAVGSDRFGDELAGALQANGVAIDRLRRVDGPSGIAVITVDDAAENTIVVAPGANGALTGVTAEDEALIRGSDVLIMQLEVPLDVVLAAARIAFAASVPVLLNPSPAQRLPAELLSLVTMLVVNEGEAAVLGADAMQGVAHAVTTLGSRGARYRGPDGHGFQVDAPLVKPVDTTGAGDAFAGALAVRWAEAASGTAAGRSRGTPVAPLDASVLSWACAAGALATTAPGAGESAPLRPDIDRLAHPHPDSPEISPAGI